MSNSSNRYEDLLAENLDFLRRMAEKYGRQDGLSPDEVEDFSSWATAKLIEDDSARLRKFRGQSTFTTYLSAVLYSLYRDYIGARHGQSRPSATGTRRGPTAILEVESDHPVSEAEREADAVRKALESAIAELPDEDQAILKLHFFQSESVPTIARALHLKQKPLYRRLDRLLRTLRVKLEEVGIDRGVVAAIVQLVDVEIPEVKPSEDGQRETDSGESDVELHGIDDSSRVSLVADLDTLPPAAVAELMAALDELHRAHGGGGLRILYASTGTAVREGVPA